MENCSCLEAYLLQLIFQQLKLIPILKKERMTITNQRQERVFSISQMLRQMAVQDLLHYLEVVAKHHHLFLEMASSSLLQLQLPQSFQVEVYSEDQSPPLQQVVDYLASNLQGVVYLAIQQVEVHFSATLHLYLADKIHFLEEANLLLPKKVMKIKMRIAEMKRQVKVEIVLLHLPLMLLLRIDRQS